MRHIVAVLFAVSLPFTNVLAATTYEVEVLVFETRLPELEGAEVWIQSSKFPAPDTADAAAPTGTPGSDFAAAATALEKDGNYRVLARKRWVQSGEAKATTKPVRITTGDNELDGTLTFYLSRFLHMEVNMAFQPSGGLLAGSSAANLVYRIMEQRRIKSQDIHYFDHPKFGVLVRVAPSKAG